MISRRSFLKVSGLAAAALSTGYGAGKLAGNTKDNFFAVHGFIPADERILKQVVASFTEKVQPASDAVIFADTRHAAIIKEIYNQRIDRTSAGNVKIRLSSISGNVQSDLLVSENNVAVLNPESLNFAFTGIRSAIQNRKAEYLISAEFQEISLLGSLFNTNQKTAVIQNEKGIVDKIDLNKSYDDISVTGPFGKTIINMSNGIIRIHSAACRNQICRHTGGISEAGQMIACAPNKVMIKIETV